MPGEAWPVTSRRSLWPCASVLSVIVQQTRRTYRYSECSRL